MTDYPIRIQMLQVNEFGRLGQLPLGSDKGRVYELVPEPSDAMSDIPICECASVWPGEGHHPECPVRHALESSAEEKRKLREALARLLWLRNDDLAGVTPVAGEREWDEAWEAAADAMAAKQPEQSDD